MVKKTKLIWNYRAVANPAHIKPCKDPVKRVGAELYELVMTVQMFIQDDKANGLFREVDPT